VLLLVAVALASGLAELFSLGAVLPFLTLISDTDSINHNAFLGSILTLAGLSRTDNLMVLATLLFVGTVLVTAIIRLANLWLNARIAAAAGSDLSCECYRRTLFQPYSIHISRNSATVISTLSSHIGGTVFALSALLQLIAGAIVAIALILGLFLIDWFVALTSATLFGLVYLLLALAVRSQLRTNGEIIATANGEQIKSIQEGLGAIRDVLLDSSQYTYLNIYRKSDWPLRLYVAKNQFLTAFPRYTLEAIGLVLIALIGLFQVKGNSLNQIPLFTLLGAMALGAQRLLPALQQVYGGWAGLNSSNASLASVLSMLDQPLPIHESSTESLRLQKSVCFDSVSFRYGSNQPEVISGLTLQIKRGECIGLIGTTGSGKSTLVDIFMGLLKPTEGCLLIDGIDLNDPEYPHRLSAWRTSIAHVPQNIFLTEGSIAENIGFGIPKEKIDMDRVRAAAEKAQISSFIETSLHGYSTIVGERGVRLSGGQRQRIGIARALYKEANILVFDEATSALDTTTENSIMESLNSVQQHCTIIIIAHRISTLSNCDRVVKIANGNVVYDGSPQHIPNSNKPL